MVSLLPCGCLIFLKYWVEIIFIQIIFIHIVTVLLKEFQELSETKLLLIEAKLAFPKFIPMFTNSYKPLATLLYNSSFS